MLAWLCEAQGRDMVAWWEMKGGTDRAGGKERGVNKKGVIRCCWLHGRGK